LFCWQRELSLYYDKMKKQSLLREILYTVTSLGKGLGVTFVHFFRKKVTVQYPEQRLELPDNYRGMPVLPTDSETGKDKCIACGSCARICPEQIIKIEHEVGEDKKRRLKSFDIDIARCMFCGLCSEACPTKGIVMSKHYELTTTSREQMVMDMDKLHEMGGKFPEKPKEPESEPEEEKKSESGGTE
jgi:NADH-quinone oxidoreductase subunit I